MVSEEPQSPDSRPKPGRVRKFFRVTLRAVLGLIAVVAVLLIGIYAVLALTEGEQAPARDIFQQSPRRPLVIAHRGGAKIGPENTLEVLRKSHSLGVDVLEIDLRLTADEKFAVIHDGTVDRTTNGSGEVASMTLAQLQSLDAGHDFTNDDGATFPYRGKGVKVPSLEEVLAEFPSSNINIEAKRVEAEHAGRLCELLRATSSPERIVVASVSGDFLEAFRASCGEFPTSASLFEVTHFLTYQKLGVARSYSSETDAFQVPMGIPAIDIISPDFIGAARGRGIDVHVWTVNDVDIMQKLIEMGVDGIITDRPDALLKLRDGLSSLTTK